MDAPVGVGRAVAWYALLANRCGWGVGVGRAIADGGAKRVEVVDVCDGQWGQNEKAECRRFTLLIDTFQTDILRRDRG